MFIKIYLNNRIHIDITINNFLKTTKNLSVKLQQY